MPRSQEEQLQLEAPRATAVGGRRMKHVQPGRKNTPLMAISQK